MRYYPQYDWLVSVPMMVVPSTLYVVAAIVGSRLVRPGTRVIVRIPPQYAYGSKGVGPIPPDAPLVFYMELVRLGKIKN